MELINTYKSTPLRRITSFLMSSDKFENLIKWEKATSDLIKLGNLENNWDEEGAISPSPELITNALDYIAICRENDMPPPSRIVASQGGEIIIEWQTEFEYWEIEITRPYHASLMHYKTGGKIEHSSFSWEQRGVIKEGSSLLHALNASEEIYAI